MSIGKAVICVFRVDRSDKVFNINCLFKQYVNEWYGKLDPITSHCLNAHRAIPVDALPEAITRLKQWIDANAYVHFPVEVWAS